MPDVDVPDNPNEDKSGDSPDDIELEPGEKAVIADRLADEHPNHPEVAGQPDPNG